MRKPETKNFEEAITLEKSVTQFFPNYKHEENTKQCAATQPREDGGGSNKLREGGTYVVKVDKI